MRYERVTFRRDGRSRSVYLENTAETSILGAPCLTGLEVDREGEEVFGKGYDNRRHVIDLGAVTKRTPMRLDLYYGELVEDVLGSANP